MSNFQLPKTTAFDTNGDPLAGAKLNFYETGTTTPLTVYQDEDNTTPHANPVVADAAGRFAPIWLQTSEEYKVVLADTDDVVIYTTDPVRALATVTTTDADRLKQIASNPLDYGAVGDGLADESTAVQSAITNATGTIDLLGKTYRCDSALTITAGKRLINGTLDFSQCAATNLISLSGGSLGSLALMTSVTISDTTIVNTTTTGLAANDYLLLTSNEVWHGSYVAGEIVRIKSVDSATALTLTSRILGTYTAAQSAQIKKVTTVKNVTFSDLTIKASSTSVEQVGIYAPYAENLTAENVRFENIYASGVKLLTAINSNFRGCNFKNHKSATNGYGVHVVDCSQGVSVSTSAFDYMRSAVGIDATQNGVNRNINVLNCNISGTTAAGVYASSPSQYVTVSGCTIDCGPGANSYGMQLLGADTFVTGNTIHNPQSHGLYLQVLRTVGYVTGGSGVPVLKSEHDSLTVTDNNLDLVGGKGIYLLSDATAGALRGVSILNNRVSGAGDDGIFVDARNAGIVNLIIDNNHIDSPGSEGIIVMSSSSNVVGGYSVTGNTLYGVGTSVAGIAITGGGVSSMRKGRICNNHIDGAQDAIALTDATYTTIDNNVIDTPARDGIQITASTASFTFPNVSAIGNTINAAGRYGVNVSVTTSGTVLANLRIANNAITASTNVGVAVTASIGTIRGLAVAGNTFKGTLSSAVYLSSTAAGTIDTFSVANNDVDSNLNEAIILVNTSSTFRIGTISGNSIRDSASTGIHAGAVDRLSIIGNVISACGANGVVAINCSDASIGSNVVSSPGIYGIYASSSGTIKNLSLSGNTVSSSIAHSILIENSSTGSYEGVSVTGNTIDSPTQDGIALSSSNGSGSIKRVNITGNTVRNGPASGITFLLTGTIERFLIASNSIDLTDASTGSCVLLSGSGATVRGFITANLCMDGAYGVRNAAGLATNVLVAANFLTSHATATTGGTFTDLAVPAVSTTASGLTNLPNKSF